MSLQIIFTFLILNLRNVSAGQRLLPYTGCIGSVLALRILNNNHFITLDMVAMSLQAYPWKSWSQVHDIDQCCVLFF